MKVLLAGVSGFLGSAIARECVVAGDEVWGLLATKEPTPPNVKGIFVLHDLPKTDIKFDIIYIAAGNYAMSPQKLHEVNVKLPQLLSDLYPHSKIIFISSTEVYGTQNSVMTETTEPQNPSQYGASKLAGETVVTRHPRHAIIRLTYLYDKVIPNTSFLPTILSSARSKKLIALTNAGERLQDYLHVSDAAVLVRKAAVSEKNGIFLGATGTSISNKVVAEKICSLVPGCILGFSGTSTAQSLRFDPRATKKALSWEPQYQLLDFLPEMITP